MSKITDIVEDLRNIEPLTGSAQEVLVIGMTEDEVDEFFITASKL